MIQILGIRTWFDAREGVTKKRDKFFEQNWRAASIPDLLENLQRYIEPIPEAERYNLFFTQSNCTEKKREFKEQWVIPFDIDGINDSLPSGQSVYEQIFADTLKLGAENYSVIHSGHGLHLMVHLKAPFTSVKYFEENKVHYRAICDKLDFEISKAGLQGRLDRGMWKPHIFFRMPGSLNKKENRPDGKVEIQWHPKTLVPITFDWSKLSGVPDVADTEQVNPKHYPAVDTQGVLNGCEFLKHCKENPNSLHEPEWYAMLSIVGRLKDGEKLSHEYSKGHKGYSYEQTEVKREQAKASSGPRTCGNISTFFRGCTDCSYYEKVNSPISIKSPDFIETETTGFHKVSFDKKGTVISGRPSYSDLRKFFERKHPYRVMGSSRICYVWKDTHFEELDDVYLENFAQTHFSPNATSAMVEEFKKLVCRTNLTTPDWFQESTEKKINFKNGVLDLGTGNLVPHSMEHGFRYVLPYDYDPYAKCPQFEKFLHQITSGDQDLQNLLMEFAGYSFSGDFPWASKVLVLTGEGSNGKSTFIDVLRALAGRDNYASLTWKDMNNQTTLQLIDGKLFNLAEEAPKHALSDSTLFKNIATGGEITVKVLYKQPFSIRNKTKLIFACNELPQSEDTTKGYFRRFLIVPFMVEFSDEKGNEDKQIRQKLFSELPGIFNLVRKGYERLSLNKKFTEAGAARKKLDEYRLETDHATRWILENVKVFPLNGGCQYSIVPEVYQSYRMEMLNTGERPVTAVGFGKKLSKVIPEYDSRAKLKKVNAKVHRVLLDCTHNSDAEM